jgi:hypothetical protein
MADRNENRQKAIEIGSGTALLNREEEITFYESHKL